MPRRHYNKYRVLFDEDERGSGPSLCEGLTYRAGAGARAPGQRRFIFARRVASNRESACEVRCRSDLIGFSSKSRYTFAFCCQAVRSKQEHNVISSLFTDFLACTKKSTSALWVVKLLVGKIDSLAVFLPFPHQCFRCDTGGCIGQMENRSQSSPALAEAFQMTN